MNRDKIDFYITSNEKNLTCLCMKLCSNKKDAEDLYQETWYRAINKMHYYNEAKPFEPWLFTICINTYRNMYKRIKNSPFVEFTTSDEKERTIENAAQTEISFNEENNFIRQIINELDERYRIVIVLYYFRDFSIAELSSIIRIPQGTVKSRLFKAREIIKRRLEENEK